MFNPQIFLSLIVISFFLGSCNDDEPGANDTNCGDKVVINEDQYQSAESDLVNIISAEITDDCLTIQFAASGCDGETWGLTLYDSGAIAESSPEQRYIRLVLDNSEECDAVFEKEVNFDIAALRISNDGVLILNLDTYDTAVNYRY